MVRRKFNKAYWTGNSVASGKMDQEPTEEPCDLHPGRAELYHALVHVSVHNSSCTSMDLMEAANKKSIPTPKKGARQVTWMPETYLDCEESDVPKLLVESSNLLS